MSEIHNSSNDDISKLSPYQLMSDFSRTPVWRYFVLAVLLHGLLIGLTSVGFIFAKITGKPLSKPPVQEQQAVVPATANVTAGENRPAIAAEDASEKALVGDTAGGTDEMMEARKQSPMMKTLLETAKPDELPEGPGDLGISLDDTAID